MNDDKRLVLKHYASAFHSYSSDTGRFKIYHMVGDCRVALSSSWETESMAWFEVAQAIRKANKVEAVAS